MSATSSEKNFMEALASSAKRRPVNIPSAQARPMRTCLGYLRCKMDRRRPHRFRNTSRVVFGKNATNSVSQIRNTKEAPNRSVSVLATYHSSLLSFSRLHLPAAAVLRISRRTAPRELKCSEVSFCIFFRYACRSGIPIRFRTTSAAFVSSWKRSRSNSR